MDTGTRAAATVRTLELAHRYLNRRERTVHEVRQYLSRHDVEESAVDAALDELVETGYLDDARYARLYTQDRRELEHWGNGRIRSSLLSRGIDAEIVEAALAEVVEAALAEPGGAGGGDAAGCELDRALALLRRRFPEPPRERRDRQRALGVLVRRGYRLELAVDALAAYSRAEV